MTSSQKLRHLKKYLSNARTRSNRDKVPFNLTLEDLIEVATDECPIFKTPFIWGSAKLGKGKTHQETPQLDRIEPHLGYVKGNVAFLSRKANRIKDLGTMQDHYDIADWIWNHTHAKKKSTTPVPARADSESENDAKRRALLAARLGEDRDDAHHHCGADVWEDANHSTQTSGGNSLEPRGYEVATSEQITRIENNGDSEPEIVRLDFSSRHLSDKS